MNNLIRTEGKNRKIPGLRTDRVNPDPVLLRLVHRRFRHGDCRCSHRRRRHRLLRNRPVLSSLFFTFLPTLILTTVLVLLGGISHPFLSSVLFENVVFGRFTQVSTTPSLGGAGTRSGFSCNHGGRLKLASAMEGVQQFRGVDVLKLSETRMDSQQVRTRSATTCYPISPFESTRVEGR